MAMVVRKLIAGLALLVSGCAPRTEPAQVPVVTPRANARAPMNAVLQGDRSQFDQAVAQLYARRDEPRTAAALARLLNLPLSEGDLRYAPLQRTLYGDLAQREQDSELDATITRGFFMASTAAEQYRQGHTLRALGTLRKLERDLEAEAQRTDNVDLHAMLGNYAHQAGGFVPVGKTRRLDLAREHLEHVVLRYDELSPTARGLSHGIPGVRVVFTLWWAQLLERDGDPRAMHAYDLARDAARKAKPTPALEVLSDAIAEGTVPRDGALWPSGYDSCVACHAHDHAIAQPLQSAG